MPHTSHQIKTRDGLCPAHSFTPAGSGPWPAVLMYMDGVGMREALMDIAQRIASEGYYVLLPDLFYRVGFKAGDPKTLFSDPVARADLMTRVLPSANAANIMSDTDAFLEHFDAQQTVKHGRIGLTGYCMGGRLSLYAAGHFGDRIAGAASYHGSGMATDAPESPHRQAAGIRARMYIAGAIEDASFDDAQKERLREALEDAQVKFQLETRPARHGWVPADMPVHDPVEAEHHFVTLFGLLESTLV